MKTPSILRLGWVLVVALVVVAGVSAFPAQASAAGITLSKRQSQGRGQAGTTLSEEVTANGHRTRTFTWTINKVANPTTLDLVQGGSDTATYTVTLDKDDGTVHTWINGEVCITNGGSVPTENLMSTLKVTQPPSQVVILTVGESYCYPYSIDVPSANSNTYKVNADTTIINHSGHLGVPFGPNAAATTTIPTTETLVHNTVTVSDTIGGPLGEFSDDHTVTYTHQFDCGNTGDNPNTASITYGDGTAGPSASATVTVKCTASGGCTRTIGYWKNHPDAVTPLLPIWLGTEGGAKSVKVTTSSQAVTIEGIPTASNGIDKLYAQLLATKLSIKNGADGSAVTSTIQAADNFLANTNSANWASLSNAVKSQVNGWATTLDNYNNGITGPGHCA
ncbi:unnamed protein product [Penicillium crustosum]